MPPKQNDASGQKTTDAMYIFESLYHVSTPVLINVNEIAAQTGGKPNTIIKRFSILRQRYPGLNIQTTAAPSKSVTTPNGSVPATPGPRRGRQASAPKTTLPKSSSKATARKSKTAIDEDDSDADEPNGLEADIIAEIADDEATPAKPNLPKRKRVSSIAGSSVQPSAKKPKSVADPDDTVSENEVSMVKSIVGDKKNKGKVKTKANDKAKVKAKSANTVGKSDGKMRTCTNQKSDAMTKTEVHHDTGMHTMQIPSTVPMNIMQSFNDIDSEDLDGLLSTDEIRGLLNTPQQEHIVHTPHTSEHDNIYPHSVTTPNNTNKLDRYHHTDPSQILVPFLHPSSPQHQTITLMTPNEYPPTQDIHTWQGTLLRRVKGTRTIDGEFRNRIVGIDIGFNDVLEQIDWAERE